METTGLIVYLMLFVLAFVIFNVVANFLDGQIKKKVEREIRRRNARFYETIDYTNFNPKTGKYENKNN